MGDGLYVAAYVVLCACVWELSSFIQLLRLHSILFCNILIHSKSIYAAWHFKIQTLKGFQVNFQLLNENK